MRHLHLFRRAAFVAVVGFHVGCATRSKIDGVVEGFFSEVNKSNFETAKVSFLSTKLINTLNSPLARGNPIEKSFKDVIGNVKSVEVGNIELKGETATAIPTLLLPWGSKWQGKMELIKEGGKEWRINDWDDFKMVGADHLRRAEEACRSNNMPVAVSDTLGFPAAAKESPKDALIRTAWARCLRQHMAAANAETLLKEVIGMYPDIIADPYLALSEVYVQQNKPADADAAWDQAIKIGRLAGKSQAESDKYLAQGLAVSGSDSKLDKAIELGQKSLAQSPDDASVLHWLGWACYRKGDREQALRYLAQAKQKDPWNREIQTHYAEASRPPGVANQASAVGSMRTINTAEITYASTWDVGYSKGLLYLAPAPGGSQPTPNAAGLIDVALASGEKNGYIFTYRAGPADSSGRVDRYSVVARPKVYGNTGVDSYYTDQTGVIRGTSENREPTATDRPIRG